MIYVLMIYLRSRPAKEAVIQKGTTEATLKKNKKQKTNSNLKKNILKNSLMHSALDKTRKPSLTGRGTKVSVKKKNWIHFCEFHKERRYCDLREP